jgi:hypothetical protein
MSDGHDFSDAQLRWWVSHASAVLTRHLSADLLAARAVIAAGTPERDAMSIERQREKDGLIALIVDELEPSILPEAAHEFAVKIARRMQAAADELESRGWSVTDPRALSGATEPAAGARVPGDIPGHEWFGENRVLGDPEATPPGASS